MREIMVAAVRGRSDGDWFNSEHHQVLEIRTGDYTNSLTSVAKDNYLIEYEKSKSIRIDSNEGR